MTEPAIIIGVLPADRDDLADLASSLGRDSDVTEQRYFDGANFLDLLLPLGTTTASATAIWATVRTWLITRSDQLKNSRVTYNGRDIVIDGMNRRDTVKVISALDKTFGFNEPPES
ncbi:hypothetical protein [Cryobacterium aureum]|uniref:hypothetical protein n=1 Tax=Cryobacterium aureum TaxID=995037 RepID=UPI00101AEC30|nr:hypothetical protein [Cryobacterium aureum]